MGGVWFDTRPFGNCDTSPAMEAKVQNDNLPPSPVAARSSDGSVANVKTNRENFEFSLPLNFSALEQSPGHPALVMALLSS